jgi:hypothetical protein
MAYKSQILAAGLIFLTLSWPWRVAPCQTDLSGQTTTTINPAQVAPAEALPQTPETLLAAGQRLREQAATLKAAADAQQAAEEAGCASKFLENDCRNAARARHLERINETRRLDAEGRELEYRARLLEREAKQEERAARQERHATELPQRLETRAAEQRAKEAASAEKQAKKAEKARQGAAKTAKRQARQAKKQAQQSEKQEKAAAKAKQP